MSLVNFKPKNHPHQVQTGGADDATDDRRTPPSIYDPLHAQHGFTLDAAASPENARCARFFDLEADGLAQPWTGEVVWCNPPYSGLAAWVRKARYEVEHGCKKVVMLLPANRTEQRWWQDEVEPYRDCGQGMTTRYLPGRPRFGTRENPEGRHGRGLTMKRENGKCVTSSPFGCVVLVIEPRSANMSDEKNRGTAEGPPRPDPRDVEKTRAIADAERALASASARPGDLDILHETARGGHHEDCDIDRQRCTCAVHVAEAALRVLASASATPRDPCTHCGAPDPDAIYELTRQRDEARHSSAETIRYLRAVIVAMARST